MTNKRKPSGPYRVANPRGLPALVNGDRIHIFRQRQGDDVRTYYEGDIYDGDSPEVPLQRGFLVEVTDG